VDRTNRVEILTGCTDSGQGTGNAFCRIASAALSVPFQNVTCPFPSTHVPDSGPTFASRTIMAVGELVLAACRDMLITLRQFAASEKIPGLAMNGDAFTKQGEPISFLEAASLYVAQEGELSGKAHSSGADPNFSWDSRRLRGSPYEAYSWIAEVLEIEVDIMSYEIFPLQATIVLDAGTVVDPHSALTLIEGGSLMAYGWGNTEEVTLKENGDFSVSRLGEYAVSTMSLVPKFDIVFLNTPWRGTSLGAKGLRDLPLDVGAPALAAAIQDAVGVFPENLPMGGKNLFALMEKLKGEGNQ
jgi:CO/xanthine dehydrogenase Mo-binding subunit